MAAAPHESFDLVNFWLALTWSITWKLLVIILVFNNFKNFPFSWHVGISCSIICGIQLSEFKSHTND